MRRRHSLPNSLDGLDLEPLQLPEEVEPHVEVEPPQENNIQHIRQRPLSTCSKFVWGATSALTGALVGMAMMPIFNREVKHLDNYGIDIHSSQKLFVASTLNTLALMTAYSACHLYKFFSRQQLVAQRDVVDDNELPVVLEREVSVLKKVAHVTASFAGTVIPVYLLYKTELDDREHDHSTGFDKYIFWLSITTIPLIVFRVVHTYQELEGYFQNNDNELKSTGSKLVVYGISALSIIPRGIILEHITKEICSDVGLPNLASKITGVCLGGVVVNIICAASEYSKLKALFSVNQEGLDATQILVGGIAALEGVWFSLPAVGVGLVAVKQLPKFMQEVFIESTLFVPMLISHSVHEASSIYEAIIPTRNAAVIEQEEQNIALAGVENDLEEGLV